MTEIDARAQGGETSMSHTTAKPRGFLSHLLFRRVSLIGTAILFGVLFAVFHLLGWRDDTAIISGTSLSPDTKFAVIRGMLYGLTYFLAVIVSPILIIAAGINALLRRWVPAGSKNPPKN
jgi:hypothetical protein